MEEHQSPQWIELGTHMYREEPEEGILYIRIRGDITIPDGPLWRALMKGFVRDGRSRVFLLGEISLLGEIRSDVRKALAESLLDVPIAATAIFGASFTQRVIATLADKTNNLIRGGQRYETRFFAGEDEARAWLRAKGAGSK